MLGMRLRRARTLVITFAGMTLAVRNFMSQQTVPIDSFTIEILCRADNWQDTQAFHTAYPGTTPDLIDNYLYGLVEQGLLVVENSESAMLDSEYETEWDWDTIAGLYHFGIQDPPWLNPEQSTQWLQHISVAKPPVPLLTSNEGLARVESLEPPNLDEGLFATLKRRRSIRMFTAESVSKDALRDCLFAGLGITGFLDTRLPSEEPRVPLKMTPSGGGRNPYEGYVLAKNVEGLESGIYHYSAVDNTLGLLTENSPVTTTEVFAQQDWTEGAGLAVFLVANFGRTMWKYPHPNAYRVILMEAGHIGQNILLMAAEHGLCGTPTAAVSDSVARGLLGLNRVQQSLVYGLFIGHPHPDAFESENFMPHPES